METKARGINGILLACAVYSVFMILNVTLFVRLQFKYEILSMIVIEAVLPVIAIAGYFIAKRYMREGRKICELFRIRRAGFINCIIAFFIPFFIFPAMNLLVIVNDLLVRSVLGKSIPTDSSGLVLKLGLIPSIILIAVIPAIFEESFFRGFFLGLTDSHNQWKVIALNGLVFSLVHTNVSRIMDTFAAGAIFAFVALRTKSIFPSVIMHFVHNLISICAVFLLKNINNPTQSQPLPAQSLMTYIFPMILAITSACVALTLLMMFKSFHDRIRWERGLSPIIIPQAEDTISTPKQLLWLIPSGLAFVFLNIYICMVTIGVKIPWLIEIYKRIWYW